MSKRNYKLDIHRTDIFRLYHSGAKFVDIADFLKSNRDFSTTPNAISNYIKKHYENVEKSLMHGDNHAVDYLLETEISTLYDKNRIINDQADIIFNKLRKLEYFIHDIAGINTEHKQAIPTEPNSSNQNNSIENTVHNIVVNSKRLEVINSSLENIVSFQNKLIDTMKADNISLGQEKDDLLNFLKESKQMQEEICSIFEYLCQCKTVTENALELHCKHNSIVEHERKLLDQLTLEERLNKSHILNSKDKALILDALGSQTTKPKKSFFRRLLNLLLWPYNYLDDIMSCPNKKALQKMIDEEK